MQVNCFYKKIMNQLGVPLIKLQIDWLKSELNMLHPFREGNGRTIRIFLQALSKGVDWNFTDID
ncbi:Fic family protein [Lysinibacillus pakistanensis]|uniref:Fic family protein n=1 Tax=Lysinibacillus pakistanensis TaxID=759811 RepID=UPI00333687BF